ncbi:hypothetical protein Spb1_41200 [Planctopirus ephydatiae]|uniref:Uncharacterized protein n=1 Tax=Planctopirus ephydatiae TaxID=2528019 RepID=A0A518GUA3_9PLAN|nr:hypothetical protein Spb1_41200 [Planctopirus ephydatiae]
MFDEVQEEWSESNDLGADEDIRHQPTIRTDVKCDVEKRKVHALSLFLTFWAIRVVLPKIRSRVVTGYTHGAASWRCTTTQ